jgi:hypothetical protein
MADREVKLEFGFDRPWGLPRRKDVGPPRARERSVLVERELGGPVFGSGFRGLVEALGQREVQLPERGGRVLGLGQGMTPERFRRVKNAIRDLAEWLRKSPEATPRARAAAVDRFFKQAAGAGVPRVVFEGIARDADLAQFVSDLMGFADDPQVVVSAGRVMAELFQRRQAGKVRPYLATLAVPAIADELAQTVPAVVRALAGLPEFRGKSIPFEAVVGLVEAIPGKGRLMAAALRGEIELADEVRDRLLAGVKQKE